MENQSTYVSNVHTVPSIPQRLSENMLVPIGITLTVCSYAVGLKSLVTKHPRLGQKMMYSRVLFQGMTVAAMFYDQFAKKPDHLDENNC